MFETDKPFSQACANNSQSILSVLLRYLDKPQGLLEIGSGTGQHAAFFAEHLPHLRWHTSDLEENHAGIHAWVADYDARFPEAKNLYQPFVLDADDCPALAISDLASVFTANTLHIMSWPQVERLFNGIGRQLPVGCLWFVYGPFNYQGKFTSESNANFDGWLKSRAPHMGIRNFENLIALAKEQNLSLLEDNEMPANNRCLVFRKGRA